MAASDDEQTTPRPHSTADLSRRVERLESDVSDLKSTVDRVELNQAHAEELSKLRFSALDQAVNGLTVQVSQFITRIEGILDGSVQTAWSRQYAERRTESLEWRKGVEERLDEYDRFKAQGSLLGKIAVLLVSGNVIAIIAALAAFLR